LGRVDRLDPRAQFAQVRHSSITLPSLDAGSWTPRSLANGGALDGDLLLLDLIGTEGLGLCLVHDTAAVGGDEALLELGGRGAESLDRLVGQGLATGDLLVDACGVAVQILEELGLEATHVLDRNRVEDTFAGEVDRHDLVLDRDGS